MTLGRPLSFCNAQFGHLNDGEADATGITRLEFYTKDVMMVEVEIVLTVVSTLLNGFSEHLGGLVPITVATQQCVRNLDNPQELYLLKH